MKFVMGNGEADVMREQDRDALGRLQAAAGVAEHGHGRCTTLREGAVEHGVRASAGKRV